MRRSKYFSSLATKRTFSSSSSSFSSSPTLKSLSSSSADVPQVKPDPDAHTAHVAKKQKKQKKGSTKRKSNSEAELTAALGKEFPVKDVLGDTCSVLFCGINPGRWSARAEHHYGNPANHFWRLLHESKLVAKPLTFREEHLAVEYGIGLTNIVHRPTTGSEGVGKEEMKAGMAALVMTLKRLKPRCLVFNGKCIFTSLLPRGVKLGKDWKYGVQTSKMAGHIFPLSVTKDTKLVVTPSSSPRVASYQFADKLVFFQEIKALVDGENHQDQ